MPNHRFVNVAFSFAVAACFCGLLSGCQPDLEDGPALVLKLDDDTVGVVFPVCEGGNAWGVDYWAGESRASIDLSGAILEVDDGAGLITLEFSTGSVASGDLVAGAAVASSTGFPGGSSFWSLDRIDVETDQYQVRLDPELLEGNELPVVSVWEYPYGKNSPHVEGVSEEDGRKFLLDWCA